MANLTTCPYCGADIEADSWYCDQCANELHRCPSCGNFCKGKFCPKCGKPTKLAKELAGTPAGSSSSAAMPAASAQPGPQYGGAPSPSPQPAAASYGGAPRPTTNPGGSPQPCTGTSIPGTDQAAFIRLVCQAMGVTLYVVPGAVIGRVTGNYASQLGTFQYLSGTQARVDCMGGQWSITDLGSRNGTAVNGMPCAPTLPLKQGDVIRFSRFYDFKVE